MKHAEHLEEHNQAVVCNSGKDSQTIKHLMNFSHSLNKPETICMVDTTDSSKPETWMTLLSMITTESRSPVNLSF